MSSLSYRREIDGLRAIAVLPVIIFHLNNDWLPGGYIGVDVFFVISGFLITSIILNEFSHGKFSLLDFWKRRIKRILPALTVVVLATMLFGQALLYGPDINNLGNQGIASLLSYANISHHLLAGNYWGHDAESSPLLHAWSLSVEEQYYLIYPLLLTIVLKYLRSSVSIVLAALCFISVALFMIGVDTNPTFTFYSLPTRAWELGFGALLAVRSSASIVDDRPVFNSVISCIGLFLILASYKLIGGDDGISRLLIVPVLGVVLVLGYSSGSTNIVNRILSVRPLAYIGKTSYSLYLWHWPVLVFSKASTTVLGSFLYLSVYSVVIFILAIASYHFIEVPARKNKKTIPVVLVAVLIGIAFAAYLKSTDLTEDVSMFRKTEWHGNLYSVNPDQAWAESAKRRLRGIDLQASDPANAKVHASGGIQKLYGGDVPEIVVLGDSHALMWGKVLDEIASELSVSIAFYSTDGIPPFFEIPPVRASRSVPYFTAEEKLDFDRAILASIGSWKPRVVVVVARWDIQDIEMADQLIKYIGNIGCKVLLIEQPPVLYFGDRNAPQYLSYSNVVPQLGANRHVDIIADSERYQDGIAMVEQLSKDNHFVSRVEVSDIYLENGKAWVIDSGDVLYIDDDHLSYFGSLKAKLKISESIKNILSTELD